MKEGSVGLSRILVSAAVVFTVSSCATPDNLRSVTQQEFGDQWPFTVSEGTLACYQNAVTFKTTTGLIYGLNGTAKSRQYPGPEVIWRVSHVGEVPTIVDRLTEAQRREIFHRSVTCEDVASEVAEERYPETNASHPRFNQNTFAKSFAAQQELARTLTDRCKARIRADSKLSERDLLSIGEEGVYQSWPPLSPARVNMAPLIAAGLALCR
jgi:hypothetical protein